MSDAETRPPLRVISGDATAEEIAAIIAVLSATGGDGGNGSGGSARRPSRWADPQARLRTAHSHGRGAWRGSVRPR